jgi:hypothetical protein
MPTLKNRASSDDKIMSEFVNLAIAASEPFGEGGVKASNRSGKKLMQLAAKIRTMEDGGRRILGELILSKHEAVRSKAAYVLLPIDPERASQELVDLSKNASNVFLLSSARVTLEEWAAGRLDTDWFIKKYGPKLPSHLN